MTLSRDRIRISSRAAEGTFLAAAALLVLAVHDVGYVLRTPWWTDESWVAMSIRYPISALRETTSSTPIGWSALARLFGGAQHARLLPLLFAMGCVVAAYVFGRHLNWSRRAYAVGAGVLCSMVALLSPAMLTRDDLKQYTADACLAVVCVAALSRAERSTSRRDLVLFVAVIPAGMLVSHTTAFVGVASVVGLLAARVARREWVAVRDAAIASAAGGIVGIGVYALFDAKANNPRLNKYWAAYYTPGKYGHGFSGAVKFIEHRLQDATSLTGLGSVWLAFAAGIAGIVTLWRLGHRAVAIACTVIGPEMYALSAAHKYPFLDARTSTFLFVLWGVVAAIGVVGVGIALRSVASGRLRTALPATVAGLAAVPFVIGAAPHVREHPIPLEDVRSQARYVATHRQPHDIVLVNLSSNWNFAYYWPAGGSSRMATNVVLQNYIAYFPNDPTIVVATGRDRAGVQAALTEAVARARAQGPSARIWLIREHVNEIEFGVWAFALDKAHLMAWPVGVDQLTYIDP